MKFSSEDFTTMVRTVAAEKPDYRYNPRSINAVDSTRCFYTPTLRPDGSTSRCLIGEALHRLGISDALMSEHDGDSTSTVHALLTRLGDHTEEVLIWANTVQAAQDWGLTWAEAVEYADHIESLNN